MTGELSGPSQAADSVPASEQGEPAQTALSSTEAMARAARMQGALLPGSTFGVYSVGECIGEGGMARIYRAEHAGLRRQVALKVLTNGFARNPEGRERFVREARIAAAIKHPNVVNIFDVGVEDDIPYLVMELLEGTDLESMLEEKGALEESAILDIMVPVVAGLTAVHDAGIVHRDLKPGNIFLAKGRYEELEPKLLDFGISKTSNGDQLKLTTSGLLLGTPFYMSPEGFRGEEMTALSDQYSLGVLMYECATGCGPFKASTLAELVRFITSGDYKPPNELNPNISKRLSRIILRAMSLDPAQRFQDLREMGRELLQLSGQRTRITWGLSFGELKAAAVEGALASSAARTAPPSAESRGPKARKAALALLLVLLPLALFALVVSVSQRATPGVVRTGPGAASAAVAPAARVGTESMRSETIPFAPEVVPVATPSASVSRLRQRVFAARARVRTVIPDESQEWALPSPAQPARTTDTKPPPGTNGAPIFD